MSVPDLVMAHLYPDLLPAYGDGGNILALQRRAEWRGFTTRVQRVSSGDPLPRPLDLIVLGGGTDAPQAIAAADLNARRREMRDAAGRGVVLLGICGGYQLLGRGYRTLGGRTIPGPGLLDLWTEAEAPRLVGPIRTEAELWGVGLTMIGFENHAGRTSLGEGARPLGRVMRGAGNDGTGSSEGAVSGSVVGTYMHGPVLALNPGLTDLVLRRALTRATGGAVLDPLDDALERRARRLLL